MLAPIVTAVFFERHNDRCDEEQPVPVGYIANA
jgi:hypothetical protein